MMIGLPMVRRLGSAVVPRLASRAVAALLAAVLASAGAAADGFEAGFAAVDITPPIGWRRAGNYTELVSTGVEDRLYAKAVVLTQGKTALALVGNDLCSVPRDLTDQARQRASQSTGILASNIAVTATHTHGGPEYHGPLRDVLYARALQENGGHDPHEPIDYRAALVDAWVGAIVAANATRRPVELAVVVPQQLGMAFNRRFLMKDGSTGWNPGRGNPNVFRPLGPVDADLPFLLVREAETGRPLGSLTVFAMHTAVYGGAPFSACYPGHLQRELRHRFKAPEFVSIFVQGCAGDVNHVNVASDDPRGEEADPAAIAARLAATLEESLPLARPIDARELDMRSVTLRSRVAPITPAEFHTANELMQNLDRRAAPFLTVVDAWRKMYQHDFWQRHGGQLPQDVQAIRLDRNTAIVLLPHEVFVELGMTIKSASPFRTTIVASLANDVDFYIPTRRAFEEGHYEPTTCPLEPGCGEALVAAAVQLLNELKPARPSP